MAELIQSSDSTKRAAVWMLGAIGSFSAMAVAGREVGTELDTFELLLYRSLIGIVIVLFIGMFTGKLREINRTQLPLHFLRNICHFTAQNLWYFALTVIPLAQVFALEFTSPIWVIVLSYILFRERISGIRIAATIFGVVGILIVTRPGAVMLNWGVIAAGLSAIGFAGTAIATKQLTKNQSLTSILFYLVTLQAVFGLICAGYDGEIKWIPTHVIVWVVIIGFTGLFAHYCLTKALSLAPATIVMPFDFARLPLIAVIGMLFYQEPLDLWIICGAVVIFAANWINLWALGREKRQSSAK